MLKYFAEYEYDGKRVTEEIRIKGESPKISHGVERWRFFKQEWVTLEGEGILIGERDYESGWIYYGEMYTLEDIKEEFFENTILHMYMDYKSWEIAVKIPSGKWYRLNEDDIVLPMPKVEKTQKNITVIDKVTKK